MNYLRENQVEYSDRYCPYARCSRQFYHFYEALLLQKQVLSHFIAPITQFGKHFDFMNPP